MDERPAGQLAQRVCTWAEARPDIRALIVTGSYARGQPDDLSDLDLELFTRAPDLYVQSDLWMADIDTVWVALLLHNDRGLPTRLVIFDGGLKVDFTICPVSVLVDITQGHRLPPLYERGYGVLVDKDHVAAHLPAPSFRTLSTSRPTEGEFTNTVREFWFEVYHVAKYLTREDSWAAKYRDWKAKELLLTMLEWYERSLHGQDYPTEHLGIRMKEWVEPEVWAQLAGTFARFDTVDSWKALDVTVGLFRNLAQETAGRLGYRYSKDLDEVLSQYVESLRRR